MGILSRSINVFCYLLLYCLQLPTGEIVSMDLFQGASVVLCAVHIVGQLNVSVEKLQVTAAQDPGSVQGFFFSLICNCHLLVLLIIFHLGDW